MSLPAAASYLTSSSPLWVTGRALLARRGVELFACWSRAGRNPDHKAIHELRIASRIVRECLLFFAPCYRSGDSARFSQKLDRLNKRLGAIRSTDEAMLFMELIVEELSPECRVRLTHVVNQLSREREDEARRVGRFLRKTRRLSLGALFKELSIPPDLFRNVGIDPFMPVRRYLRDTLRLTLAAMEPLADTGRSGNSGEALRQWRIATKNLNYLLELVAPVMIQAPPDLVLLLLERYRELLEALHDLNSFRELMEKLVTDEEALRELLGIIIAKQSGVRSKLSALLEEQPWERLLTRIEESL